MNLIFGSDHAGFHLRKYLSTWAKENGHSVTEVGATSEEAFDYPIAAKEVAEAVANNKFDFGILICGSGVGVCIGANRFKKIRAANCCSVKIAQTARQHDHANILCLGERCIDKELALEIFKTFLDTKEDVAQRHQRRVQQLDEI